MADRVVSTILFVLGIVAAGSVGTGKNEGQLLHVHRLARNAEIDRAHNNDAPAIARNASGQFDRLGGRTGRRDNYDIGSVARKLLDP
jgi:hypothetical protein